MKKPWEPDRWTYAVEEVSNGLYVATADDHQGTALTRQAWCFTDEEFEDLLQAVKNEAADITRRRLDAAQSSN